MKWIASSILLLIVALAVFATVPSVNALPHYVTPTPAPTGTPVSAGSTPTP